MQFVGLRRTALALAVLGLLVGGFSLYGWNLPAARQFAEWVEPVSIANAVTAAFLLGMAAFALILAIVNKKR